MLVFLDGKNSENLVKSTCKVFLLWLVKARLRLRRIIQTTDHKNSWNALNI